MMSIRRLHCWFFGHDWRNLDQFPVHGYRSLPYRESYCDHCGLTGWEFYKENPKIATDEIDYSGGNRG